MVTILRVPCVPTVNTAVSLLEPVIVIALPFTATSSTVNAVRVPRLVTLVCAAVESVPASSPDEP